VFALISHRRTGRRARARVVVLPVPGDRWEGGIEANTRPDRGEVMSLLDITSNLFMARTAHMNI